MPKKIETATDISNLALLLIRQQFIDALTDDASIQAKACNLVYENCRLTLLEKYVWNFAIKYQALKNVTDQNVKGIPYKYVYLVPEDFIRLIDVVNESGGKLFPPYNSRDAYLFVNRRVYCGIPPITQPDGALIKDTVFAKYIYNFEEVKLMPEYFKEVLMLEIALKLTNFFDDSKPYISLVNGMLEQKLDEAKRIDAQQAVMQSLEYSPLDVI